MTDKNIGGLNDYIVLKKEKEVVFYLHNPYPDCLAIPEIMKERFPDLTPEPLIALLFPMNFLVDVLILID